MRGLGIIALIGLLFLTGCGQLFPNTYRFRMTVEVETPEGIKTGSSVYEVKAADTGSILPEGAKRTWTVKGEAVAVDLGGGRTLFSLLKTSAHFGDLAGLSMNTLYPEFREEGYDVVGVAAKLGERESGDEPAIVGKPDYPMLVTFADIADPKSVGLVEPDNLAASFGEGVALKRITVEITDEDVTSGIEELLPKPPYIRSFIYEGEESSTLQLYKGKRVTEVIGTENFMQGTTK